MNFLQQRLTAATERTANLVAQLRELYELRERVRKAELSARPRRLDPVKTASSINRGDHDIGTNRLSRA